MNRWAAMLLSVYSWDVIAAGPLPTSPIQQDISTERYANDLIGDDASDRLYAARVLHRRVRQAWRRAGKDDDGFHTIEARQTLAHFDLVVAPRCIRQMSVKNVRVPCARILGMLETADALPALQLAANRSLRAKEKRAIGLAVRRIKEAM